jgi:predicted metal-dependent peptidase
VYGDIIEQLIKQGKNPDDVENKLRGNQGSPNGSGMDWHEDPGDGEGMSEAEMEREAHNWQKNLANAATYAKQQGKLPAGMQRLMDELLKPRVSWKSLLMKYLRQHLNPTDWSYHKPGRKSHALDVFLPTVIKEGCSVEVICDTSGSIGNDTLKEFLTEIVAIARAMPDLEMWVTFVDAAVHTRYKIDSGEFAKILAMKAEGGGGTSMEAGLDYVKENNPAVPVTVVLTDGYDSWRRTKTDYPFDVIWCITRDGISDLSVIPYGQKVKMDG